MTDPTDPTSLTDLADRLSAMTDDELRAYHRNLDERTRELLDRARALRLEGAAERQVLADVRRGDR